MPTPFMCHECDSTTMNSDGICDNCVEPTTADKYNKEYYEDKEEKANHKRCCVNGTEDATSSNRSDRLGKEY